MTKCSRCGNTIGTGYAGDNMDPMVIFYQSLQGTNAEDEHYCKECVAEMRCLVQAVTPRPFQVQDILEVSDAVDWEVVDTKEQELLTSKSLITTDLTIKSLLRILHREVVSVKAKNKTLVVVSKGGK